ncbi:TonB-dependent receptor [Chryseolinea sp. H1M3-3]|uniref:TonB-dependent receptor domain-containing protein n=1 Tax=Chryseolinea sp. H1M3-3 TaxID=3034144 RepID=UPI0023EA8C32|nr:TonB-dependent receptor [Chryseolinea sp. H1M3-3]
MRTSLLILLFSYPLICCFSQGSIKGKITDGQQDLSSVTVLLLDSGAALVKGVTTDSIGEFLFENVGQGVYVISASMIGYADFISPRVSISNDAHVAIPQIVLNETSIELNEVIIKAEKPFYEQRMDRLVINVQGSITSAGNTILELLQKSPGVVVNKQNNSISMNGKSGVRIMIDGKLTQLPTDVIVQMLDGMNSSNVEKIELITTPPAKYDAEGNAGIIHIVTKGNADFGTNGTIGITLGAHWAETLGGNFNLNSRNKKFAYSLDYSVLRNHNLHIMKMNRRSIDKESVQTINGNSDRENVTHQQNLTAGFEWNISDKTMLNLLLTGYRRDWRLKALANEINNAAWDSTVIAKTKINESNIWQSVTGAMGLHTKLNSKNEINFNLDYLFYHNSNPSDYNYELSYSQRNVKETSKIDLKKNTPIHFIIGKMDYVYAISPYITLEAGVKAVVSTLSNDILVKRTANDTWAIDPAFTSNSNLREYINAAYVSSKWTPDDRWQISTGLRYEYTHTSIGTPTEKNLVDRKYGYFFPSISLKKDFDHERDLQFSFSRRITRPTYNDMAPFVFFWGPSTFSGGNTTLRPAVSNAFKIGYHVKNWLISLHFNHSLNEITVWQPEIDSETNVIYRAQNLKYLKTFGITTLYNIGIASYWEVQSNVTAQYQIAQTSQHQHHTRLHQYGINFNLINIVKLPRDFTIEISGMYQSKTLSGIAWFMSAGSLNAGIQKQFGKKGTLRFSIDDILNTNNWRIKTDMPEENLYSYFHYNFNNRFVRVTFTRTLGNHKPRVVKSKTGSDEERGRISN